MEDITPQKNFQKIADLTTRVSLAEQAQGHVIDTNNEIKETLKEFVDKVSDQVGSIHEKANEANERSVSNEVKVDTVTTQVLTELQAARMERERRMELESEEKKLEIQGKQKSVNIKAITTVAVKLIGLFSTITLGLIALVKFFG